MFKSHLISLNHPLLLLNALLVVLILLLLDDRSQKVITAFSVHLEDSFGDDVLDLGFGQMVQQVPIIIIDVLVLNGTCSIFTGIGPLLLDRYGLIQPLVLIFNPLYQVYLIFV